MPTRRRSTTRKTTRKTRRAQPAPRPTFDFPPGARVCETPAHLAPVLAEIDALLAGTHARRDATPARHARCPESQKVSRLLAEAARAPHRRATTAVDGAALTAEAPAPAGALLPPMW